MYLIFSHERAQGTQTHDTCLFIAHPILNEMSRLLFHACDAPAFSLFYDHFYENSIATSV
jgi:hypothetical protein